MKIRALTTSHTLPSFNASVSSISYGISAQTITYSESTPDISYDIFIVPITNLPGLSVTVTDSVPLFTFGRNSSDSITVSENVLKSIVAVFSNSVTASDTSFRAFSSSVDFDPSDDDIDPDPVNVSDSQVFSSTKVFSNSVSLSDSPVLNPGKVTTDSVTSGDTAPVFTVGQTSSDSVTSSDAAPVFAVTKPTVADSISASESVAKSVAKSTITDSVTSGDTAPVLNPGKVTTDSVTSGDTAPVFAVGQTSSDSVSASESVAKAITTPTVADSVSASESDAKTTTKILPLDKEDAVTVTYTQAYSSGGVQIIFDGESSLNSVWGRDQNCAWAADIQLKSSYSGAECIWDVGGAFHGSYLGITSTGKLRYRGGEGRTSFQTTSTNGFVVEIDIADYPQFFDNQTHTLAWDISMADKRGRLWIDNQLVMEESCSGALGANGAGFWSGGNDSGFGIAKGNSVAGGSDGVNQSLQAYTGTITGNLRFYKNQLYTDVIGDFATVSDTAPVLNPGKVATDSVSTSDAAPVFTVGQTSSDSVSTSESVSTELLLGATTPLFSHAFVSDGPFVRTLFNAQSHYNNNNYAYEAQTGILNGPGMIGNSPMFNDLFITYTQNDGFSIDFIYTSVDDRAINGYMLNETVMVGTSLNV